jgi:hypothetical protein
MAMKRSGHQPGGGYHSNKRVEKPVIVGRRAEAINERGVSQIGQSIGNKVTDRAGTLSRAVEPVRGAVRPEGSPGGVKLGNVLAASAVCGPGGSREVSKSGTQQQWGGVAGSPKPQGREILREFGPDVPGRGGRS